MKNLFLIVFVSGFFAATAGAACTRTPGVTPPDSSVSPPESSWYSCTAVPVEMEVMGSDFWQNSNGGGVQLITDPMPDSMAIFLIRPTDSALEMMAAQLEKARENGDSVLVQFRQADPDPHIGNVVSIRFLKPHS